MNKYELILFLKPTLNREELNKEKENIESKIKAISPKLLNIEEPDLKDLAYEIKGNNKGFYMSFQFLAESPSIVHLSSELKDNNNILKYMDLCTELNVDMELDSENKNKSNSKVLKGENGLDYLMIESKENVALLKSLAKDEYVVANGYRTSNDNKISWNYGSYYENLSLASVKFNELTLSNLEQIQSLKEVLNESRNFVSFASILEFSLHGDDEVTPVTLMKCENIFDKFLDNDYISLVSEELKGLDLDFDMDYIKEQIQEYLEKSNVNMNQVTDEILDEMVKDVLDYSLEMGCVPYDSIWNNEYFEGEIENFLDQEEEE